MKITARKNHIIFKFEDQINTSTKNNLFKEKTSSGLLLPSSHDLSSKSPRWGVVISAGGDCKTIKTGMRVLIEPLAWTNAIPLENDERVWKTDETRVLMYEES